MVNIKDVAARANVSVGTVSRVLAKNETVGRELRELVEATIRELNFRPSGVARGLSDTAVTKHDGMLCNSTRLPA